MTAEGCALACTHCPWSSYPCGDHTHPHPLRSFINASSSCFLCLPSLSHHILILVSLLFLLVLLTLLLFFFFLLHLFLLSVLIIFLLFWLQLISLSLCLLLLFLKTLCSFSNAHTSFSFQFNCSSSSSPSASLYLPLFFLLFLLHFSDSKYLIRNSQGQLSVVRKQRINTKDG